MWQYRISILLNVKIVKTKILIRVGPCLTQTEPIGTGQLLKSLERVFVGVFGMDRFTFAERETLPFDCHDLRFFTDQVHFDAILRRIVKCPVAKTVRIEVGIE
jgi:hypothetical protein